MEDRIRNRAGHVVARIETHGDRKIVKDAAGRVLGYVRPGGTFDRTGRRISLDENPALLLEGE